MWIVKYGIKGPSAIGNVPCSEFLVLVKKVIMNLIYALLLLQNSNTILLDMTVF